MASPGLRPKQNQRVDLKVRPRLLQEQQHLQMHQMIPPMLTTVLRELLQAPWTLPKCSMKHARLSRVGQMLIEMLFQFCEVHTPPAVDPQLSVVSPHFVHIGQITICQITSHTVSFIPKN